VGDVRGRQRVEHTARDAVGEVVRQYRARRGPALLLLAVLTSVMVTVYSKRAPPFVGTVPVGRSPGYIAVDPRTGRAFVSNFSDDSVSVLDIRSGAILRTVAVGIAPSVVAVDVRTDRPGSPQPGR
jgi:YVTN family beta-propeller protein